MIRCKVKRSQRRHRHRCACNRRRHDDVDAYVPRARMSLHAQIFVCMWRTRIHAQHYRSLLRVDLYMHITDYLSCAHDSLVGERMDDIREVGKYQE